MKENEVILRLENIVKVFPGVIALDNISLEIRKGEIHAICGENGAGKSTLMKIITGAYTCTSGKIYFQDKEVKFSSTKQSEELGISMIYQEFNLIPHLTVGENIFLGRQPVNKMGFVDWNKLYSDAKVLLSRVGLNIDPKKLIKDISVAETQMVEIAKCLSVNSKVIIMDEPTAALSDEEIKKFFSIIKKLTEEDISIIYITHRLEEIFELTDRVTVFRDGKFIKEMKTSTTNHDELVSLMVGKNITHLYPKRDYQKKDVVFQVKKINNSQVKNADFELYRGEILGIYGLLGSGNISLSKSIYGFYEALQGEIYLEGNKVNINKPSEAIKNGISLVSDDRKNEGLILIRNIRENISLASLGELEKNKVLDLNKEKKMVYEEVEKLNIKLSSIEQIVGNLSGGNQQKVVFAKILETKPKILILDEPTRGVDVGAKAEIYQIMDQLTQKDISIILVSTDLPELIGMSDRVLVMREGAIVKELNKEQATQKAVLSYAVGGINNEEI